MQPIKVILIDDEKEMCNDLKEVIEEYKNHIQITTSYNAIDALEKLQQQHYHVLVTDIRMPDMDGLQLMEKAKSIQRELQQIVITGHGDLDYAIKAMNLGAVNFFKKPLDIKLLSAGIENAFDKYKLHKKLIEGEKIFRALTLSAQDAIVMTDSKDRIIFWNKSAERLFQYSSNECNHQSLCQLIIPESMYHQYNQWVLNLKEARTGTEMPSICEFKARKKNGKFISIELSYTIVQIQEDISAIIIIRDISKRNKQLSEIKKLKNEAIQMAEKAENANNAKSEFLTTMSHEIRTPMNAVIGLTYLLIDTSLAEEQRQYVVAIKNSAESLLTIINDIIELAKIESGKLTLDPVHYAFKDCMVHVIDIFMFKAQSKGIELDFRIDKSIPEFVFADKGRIRQILVNLIGNAMKFTASGHIFVLAEMISQKNETITLRFSVEDTGIGISKDQSKKLFKNFSQANSDILTKYGGSGLGLSISKHLCELMGGDIGVDSTVGIGSTFWFTVNLKRSHKDNVAQKESQDRFTTMDLSHLSILLVEDNEMNQFLVKRVLERNGCQITIADDGLKAVEILSSQTFDLVFMDVQMPNMGGYEATKIIRNPNSEVIDHNVPIVAMTAHATSEHQEKSLASGMNGFLTKPITPQSLRSSLSAYLSDKSTQKLNKQPVLKNSLSNQLAVFDEKKLMRSTDNDEDLALLIMSQFLKNAGSLISSLQKSHLDPEEITDIGHTVKGLAKTVGAVALAESSYQLEKLKKNTQKDHLNQLIAKIAADFELFQCEIKKTKWADSYK